MNLNRKFLFQMLLGILIPLFIGLFIMYYIISSSVQNIEIDKAKQNLQNVNNYFDVLTEFHGSAYQSYTQWADYCDAITKRDMQWLNDSVISAVSEDVPAEKILVFDKNGDIVGKTDIPKEWDVKNIKEISLFSKLENRGYCSGLARTSDGLYLLTVVKVVKENDTNFSNVYGYTLYARKVSTKMIEQAKQTAGVDISIVLDSNIKLFTKDALDNGFVNLDSLKSDQIASKVKRETKYMAVRAVQPFIKDNKQIGYLFIESVTTSGVSALNTLIISFFILGFFAVILSLVSLWWIRLFIINPIKKAADLEQKVSEGNLLVRETFSSSDEIGKLITEMNNTADKLEDMVKGIKNTAHVVVNTSNEISEGSKDLAQRTQEQAAALEETSSAMEELTATVKQNADNAKRANTMSKKARDVVSEGNEAVKRTIVAMNEINQSSTKISEIISVVNEIAFQTNLLALNAAVEAARAGEQGRGFAVVAVEVRNLAGRSAEAAKEIQTLINESVDKINNGHELVLSTGEYLDKIIESVQTVNELISEISIASNQQSIGIDGINKALVQLDQATQQNTSLTEETSAATEVMNEEANELFRLVSQFKTNE